MPRKKRVFKKIIRKDIKYDDHIVERLVTKIMNDGKKNTARRLVYKTFDQLSEKFKDDPVKIFKKALSNIKPVVEVKSRRVGGATYQVPVEVRPERRLSLGLKWLVSAALKRSGKSMVEKLRNEVFDALENRGGAIKQKETVHRMADANKAFAHFRW
jgi:small subunit ribosomal protein S7